YKPPGTHRVPGAPRLALFETWDSTKASSEVVAFAFAFAFAFVLDFDFVLDLAFVLNFAFAFGWRSGLPLR
ncbi:MAG: hypothetical protein WBP70_24180, partial [Terriglobales bacterium]